MISNCWFYSTKTEKKKIEGANLVLCQILLGNSKLLRVRYTEFVVNGMAQFQNIDKNRDRCFLISRFQDKYFYSTYVITLEPSLIST